MCYVLGNMESFENIAKFGLKLAMILFFGTRPGKQIYQKLSGVPCTYCSLSDRLMAVSQASFFHLFWIPLCKIGTSHFVECSHCKKVYHKDEFSDDMKRRIQNP